jgi:capsular exopolysaccharide synthesis family protein
MELERNIQSAQRAIDWLLDQQRQYQEGLLQSEKEIQALEKELGIVVARGAMQAKTLDFLQDQFGHLGSEVANASLERIQQSIRYKQLTTSLSSSREALELTPEVQTNAFLQSLFRDRTAKLREIEDLKKFAGPRNPDLVRLQNEVKRVDQSIDAEIAKIIKMVKAVGDAAADREQKFMEELEKVRAQVDKLNDKKWRYKKLRDDADQSNQLYDFLLKKAKETSLAAEVKTSNIQILSRAFPPAFRSRSSRDRRVKMSVLLGAALGVALAFALDYLDRSVKGAQDIERLLGLPVLAAINRFPGKHGRHAPPELIVANRPKSAFAEAFRTLRMRLSVGGRMEKALLITSAGPAEGKSTVAANLAVAMAETGKSVLLIDADIRKPSIRNVFELDPAKHPRDFVSYLRGEAPLEEVTVPVEGVRNLSLVPTMRSVSAAEVSHVMDPERVGKMLAAATAGFDRVIVDSPPMGAVGEPQMLASVIKSVVLVVRAGHTGRGMVQRAVDHLAEAGVAPAGIVLNFVDVDRRGQYGRYYGYGYGYGGAYGGGDEATRDSAAPG